MRLIVIALTLVSATLAGTTVYFARELELERERSRAVAPPHRKRHLPGKPQLRLPAAAPSVANPTATSPPRPKESEEADVKKMQIDVSRRTLEMLTDPTQREGCCWNRK